jgi:hypothetical protein
LPEERGSRVLSYYGSRTGSATDEQRRRIDDAELENARPGLRRNRPRPRSYLGCDRDPPSGDAVLASAALEGDPQVHLLGAAGDLLDTMRLLRSFQPDIVLLDAGVLSDEGIRRLPLLRSAAPTTAFLVLGMGDHPAYAAHRPEQ